MQEEWNCATLTAMTKRMRIVTGVLLVMALTGVGTADALLMGDVLWLPDYAKEKGIPPEEGPSLAIILHNLDLAATESSVAREESLLTRVVPEQETIHADALLKDNDRMALMTWVQSPHVKEYFGAMRRALLQSFSSQVQDIQDETLDTNGPVRNILSFTDPAISPDRISIVRVQDRLYELHIAEDQLQTGEHLIDQLTQ